MSDDCPFCHVEESQVVFRDDLVFAIWDRYPVPGEPDNVSDGHGFDFRFRHASKLWHVEVKATTGDDEQFDVSIGEIEVASRLAGDPSKPWRFLRITNALSATPAFEWLPNPFDEKFRKLYRIQKAGMRISYARKAK